MIQAKRTIASIVLSAFGAACASGTPDDVGQTEIIGGANFSGLPAVGALTEAGWAFCTGTLIAPRKVLTAAHCLDGGREPSSIYFTFGPDAMNAESAVRASSYRLHPRWPTRGYDIAVLTLSADAPVQPIAVLTELSTAMVGQTLDYVGYGVSDGAAKTGFGHKRRVQLQVTRLQSNELYAYSEGKSICYGDSGGATIAYSGAVPRLAGVNVAVDSSACQRNSISTRVDRFLGFIADDEPDDSAPEPPPSSQTDPVPPTSCSSDSAPFCMDADVMAWCDHGTIRTFNCGQVGSACGTPTGQSGAGCVPQNVDPCSGETATGRCDNDSAVWCDGDAVQRDHCASNMRCEYQDSIARYACVPAGDPCEGETQQGRCTASTATWCDGAAVRQQDCSATGQVCGAGPNGENRCRPAPASGCGEITDRGVCRDSRVLTWCEAGNTVRVYDCTQGGRSAYVCADARCERE